MKNILIDMEVHEERLQWIKNLPGIGEVELIDFAEEPRVIPKEVLKDKHYLFCLVPPVNVEDMDSLEFIQLSSAGYSQLYGLDLPEKGIRAANGQGVSDVPIAEWCISNMINLVRNMRGLIRNQESRIWGMVHEISRRKSAIMCWASGDMDRSDAKCARLAKAHGMKVVVFDKVITRRSTTADFYSVPGTGDPEAVLPDTFYTPGQETEFLADLDFLVLTMPLTSATRGIIGEKELRALPKRAYVLNPARGPLIVEEALLKALREGWIAGAALDTHYYYPMPPDHPLWCFPNVIFTPHIAGSSVQERTWSIFAENVERMLAGRPLMNELTCAKLHEKE